MSRVVLELNDQALRLYNDDGLQLSSPGYALVIGSNVQFGQQAAEQSRLHPVSTNNEFWHRLSMEPLPRPLAHYRHYADIAYAHLMDVAEQSGYRGPVILAVPGSYNRQQLAVLSGVLQHSPFRAEALVDAGLLAVLSQLPGAEKLIYVDLQLHQLTLASLHREQGQWRRDTVQSVQSAGWHNLANAMVQVINDAFVAQCRFNPQHNASWEQHLYNELPRVLAQIKAGEHSVAVTMETGQTSHEARVSRDDLSAELEPVFRKMAQQLQALAPASAELVLVSERAALIPGLLEWLGGGNIAVSRTPISSEQMAAVGLQLDIGTAAGAGAKAGARQVPYVTQLAERKASRRSAPQLSPELLSEPSSEAAPPSSPSSPPQSSPQTSTATVGVPTHILLAHQAHKLQGRMSLTITPAGPSLQSEGGLNSVCQIHRDAAGVIIHPAPGATLGINGKPLIEATKVRTGDTLYYGEEDGDAYFIQVLSE